MKKYKFLSQALSIIAIGMLSYSCQANYNVEQLTKNPDNWASWGGNYAGTRYSELDQINSNNVKNF